jgi:hypothetical protein
LQIRAQEFVLRGSWGWRMVRGILLDQVLSILHPVVEAAIHLYMGLILTVKHEYPSMQNTDGFSDLVQGHPGNRLEDSVVKIPSKFAQTLVALNIRRRGNK